MIEMGVGSVGVGQTKQHLIKQIGVYNFLPPFVDGLETDHPRYEDGEFPNHLPTGGDYSGPGGGVRMVGSNPLLFLIFNFFNKEDKIDSNQIAVSTRRGSRGRFASRSQ